MQSAEVSNQLKSNYENFYRDPKLAEWRRLGAIDKTANIIKLCQGILHDSVLEIGAVNGAILENLSARGLSRPPCSTAIAPFMPTTNSIWSS